MPDLPDQQDLFSAIHDQTMPDDLVASLVMHGIAFMFLRTMAPASDEQPDMEKLGDDLNHILTALRDARPDVYKDVAAQLRRLMADAEDGRSCQGCSKSSCCRRCCD
jgi:hypothetical protein